MFKVPTIQIQQKGVTIYVTALPFRELRKHMKVDYYRPDNPEGYQRPLVDRRLGEIAKYVLQDIGVLPTSVLLCARTEDELKLSFDPKDKVEGFATWGWLTIPDDAVLWVVDGQHRSFGVNRGYEKDGAVELEEYPFPITIMTGVDRYAEMLHFNIINTTQRKMSTDIVDRHLVMKAQREGIDLIAKGKEKEYNRAKATRIVDKLNELVGPWFHQIAIPGVPGRDSGLIRQHAMVTSLEPVIKDAFISTLTEDEMVKIIGYYWEALKSVWQEAFATPDEYRVQATVGIYSLHMVLPSVVQVCLSEHELSQKKMQEIWSGTSVIAQFWKKDGGDPLTLGTGMASIRALAQYLKEQLPKAHAVSIS